MASTTEGQTNTTNPPTDNEIPLQSTNEPAPASSQTLTVNFSWKKFQSLITIASPSSPEPKPLYTVSYKSFKPNLIFKSATDGSPIGTGTLHPVSIDGDCSLRGRPIKIKALKRFKTSYSHLSHTFRDSATNIEDAPVSMTWTSSSGWSNWDFICLDQNQLPVAKFSANTMSLRNVGYIEFFNPEVLRNEPFREEIMVVGMTLMYTMALRTSSVLSLFGAIISKPGKREEGKPHEQ